MYNFASVYTLGLQLTPKQRQAFVLFISEPRDFVQARVSCFLLVPTGVTLQETLVNIPGFVRMLRTKFVLHHARQNTRDRARDIIGRYMLYSTVKLLCDL